MVGKSKGLSPKKKPFDLDPFWAWHTQVPLDNACVLLFIAIESFRSLRQLAASPKCYPERERERGRDVGAHACMDERHTECVKAWRKQSMEVMDRRTMRAGQTF